MTLPTEPTPSGAADPTAVLYLRVSTLAQVKTDYDPEGISLPAQREAAQRKAAQLGARVIEEYIEPGKTATSMDKRPAFQAMLERIRTRRDVTYVIVYKLSRMNRNRLDDALTLASLRKYKATLVSATESIDQTPVGQLMHGILAAFNEYRSAEDGADIAYKMGQKAKSGGTLGRARLGYLNVRDHFEGREVRTVIPDPDRAPLITLAFELYATGQYSLERLIDELTDRGLRTRPGRRPSGPIADSTLSVLLRDRYYLGCVTYQGVEYPGRHQPLVTQEVFDQVQTLLEASGVSGERRRRHEHYLKGSLWCARCHARGAHGRLTLAKATGRRGSDYYYFLCRGRQDGHCDLPYLPTDHVEDIVERYWTTQRLPADFSTQVRATMRAVLEETTASKRLLHDQLASELAAIDRQEENLLDLVADTTLAIDAAPATAKIRTRLARLQKQRQHLQERLADTDDRLHHGAAVLEAQLDLLQRPDELYRRLNDHGRRLLNQAIFEELLIDQDLDDHTIQIAGQTYSEPVRDLLTAANTHRTRTATNGDRPADNGGPITDTLSTSPGPIPWDGGSSKTHMVEATGLEPVTPCLQSRCAASCATPPAPALVVRAGGRASISEGAAPAVRRFWRQVGTSHRADRHHPPRVGVPDPVVVHQQGPGGTEAGQDGARTPLPELGDTPGRRRRG
jgi:site-specific DNA recombinase